MAHRYQRRVGQRRGRGRAGPRVEQREFTEQFAGPEDRQQALPAVGGRVSEFDLALGDDEHPVAGLTFEEEVLALGQADLDRRGLQSGGGLFIQGGEQGAWRKTSSTFDSVAQEPAFMPGVDLSVTSLGR